MKETTSIRLKKLLSSRNLRQVDVLEMANPYSQQYGVKLSKSDLSQYISGKVIPGQDKLSILALALNVSEAWLMGYDVPMQKAQPLPSNIIPLSKTKGTVPLIGTIACKSPIFAEQNVEALLPLPEFVHADFALRCKGNSMVDARILDGDFVYIRQQPDVENGEIAAVLIEDEATLKRVYRTDGQLVLQPANTQYVPLVYTGAALDHVRILGKAVYFVSAIR